MDEPSNEFFWWSGIYLTPDEAMKVERVNYRSGFPLHWTIIKDPASYGWAVKLIGYPIKQETIDFTYRRRPRPIRYSGHEAALRQGTIARSSATVTGTGTAFSSAMVGSILRVGDTTNSPGPMESITPWVSESKITAVASATGLTTADSGTVASSTKYLITDPIDEIRSPTRCSPCTSVTCAWPWRWTPSPRHPAAPRTSGPTVAGEAPCSRTVAHDCHRHLEGARH
jgi:hypothetical protein